MTEQKVDELFGKIKSELPSGVVSDMRFEGCEIIIYTKNKDFFIDPGDTVINLVKSLKKRIILRPDPSICSDTEIAEKAIREIVPKEANIASIDFEPEFGKVIIEAEKPGLVIGKDGETLKEIKKRIIWLPIVKRAPVIKSDIVKVLRELIHRETAFRKAFLHKVGKRIHSGWRKTDWIRVTALGGFREVGRSAILLSTPESRVLMDCGIKPGTNEFPYLNIPEADIHNLDAVVLTHAHMDHSGLIPWLYEYGCEAPLYLTEPTRDLMVLLAMDYIELSQKEGKDTIYTTKGIREAVKRSITLRWGEVSDITPDMRLTLLNSGHILGSSLVHIHVGEGLYNILYTGDMKFDKTILYNPASTNFTRAETVIIESTYGSAKDKHPRRSEAEALLYGIVENTMKRGGKVLIPSFAVERSQDIMAILVKNGLKHNVYLDGMVWDATAIHTAYPEYLSREMQKMILQENKNPFTDPIFKRIGSEKERKEVLNSNDPAVIIATSGMLIGGPSIWWLRNLAEDSKNSLIFVGYQSEGTLGRRIQKGWKEVPMEEKGKQVPVKINCEVHTIEGLSGHSDQKQLLNYLSRLKQRPERVITDHGENSKCVELAKTIHKVMKVETVAPKNLETIRLK